MTSGRRPTIFMHIGYPKAGTIAVEQFLRQNYEILSAASNLLYFDQFHGYVRHNWLFNDEEEEARKNEALRRLYVMADGRDVFLFCNDIYQMVDNSDAFSVDFIKSNFPGYDIKIILYIRRPDDFLKSLILQIYKHGLLLDKNEFRWARDLDDYTGAMEKFPSMWQRTAFFPSRLIQKIHRLFGRENCITRLYDRKSLVNNNMVDDLFQAMGKEIPAGAIRGSDNLFLKNPRAVLHTGQEYNISLPPETLPFFFSEIMPLGAGQAELRAAIAARVARAFTQKNKPRLDYLRPELEEEIRKVDELVPGYKALFEERPLDFDYPEADIKNPERYLAISLIYLLLDKVDRLEKRLPPEKAPLKARLKTAAKAFLALWPERVQAAVKARYRALRRR